MIPSTEVLLAARHVREACLRNSSSSSPSVQHRVDDQLVYKMAIPGSQQGLQKAQMQSGGLFSLGSTLSIPLRFMSSQVILSPEP